MTHKLKMTVVIPTTGVSAVLQQALNLIDQQKLSEELEIILVVNNPSADVYRKIRQLSVSSKALVRIEWIKVFGVNRARNLGLQLAQSELVFFLDDDCLPENPLLMDLHAQAHREVDLFAVGGGYSISHRASYWGKIYQIIQMQWLYSGLYGPSLNLTSHLIGGHFSIKKSICVERGLTFNEEIIYGGSELEFFLKAHQQKLKMRLFDWVVLHCPKINFLSLSRKIFKQGKGKAIAERQGYSEQKIAGLEAEDFIENNGVIFTYFVYFFQIIFWVGFYHEKRRYFSLLKLLFVNCKNSLILRKYFLLDNISKMEQRKKQSGDRF